MAAVLPGVFLLLATVYFGALDEWRIAFLKGAIACGVAIVVNTEVLSLAQMLHRGPLTSVWAVESLVVAVLTWPRRGALLARIRELKPSHQGWRVIAALFPIFAIAAAVGVIAVVAPPNTFDSMTYHMPRVAHWAADGTVAFYPTSIIRQLYSAPGAEYAMLQLQVLSGGDRVANLVQCFCMVGSVIGASLIAKQLGAPLRGQVFAAIAVGTLPMGILQASSTQNDYAVAFWLICVVAMGFAYVTAPSLQGAFWVASSLGLGLVTKGTGYVFAAPFVLVLGGWMVLRLRARLLAPAAVMVAVPLLLNLGIYVRNESLFHNPLAPADETASVANETLAPAAIASNIVRDAVLQFGTPLPSVNHKLQSAIEKLHTGLFHIDVNDPRTTWASEPFKVNAFSLDEDYAGNPLQAILAVAAILVALSRWHRAPPLALYAAALVAAFILFAAYLKWQPWHARLELPLLVASGPLIGALLGRRFNAATVGAIAAVLIVASIPFVIDNQLRPMVGFAINPRLLPEGETIFNSSRVHLYFVKDSSYETPSARVAAESQSRGCHEIALWIRGNDWEYPLWAITEGARFDHVFVKNVSASTGHFGSRPCLLVATVSDPPDSIDLDGVSFTQSWSVDRVAFYSP